MIGVGVAAVMALAGCSGSSGSSSTTAETSTEPAWPPPTNAEAAPPPAGVLGQSLNTSLGVKATPITFENPTSRQPDPDFARHKEARPWALLDAELCAGLESKLTKTGYGFSLLDNDNREYKSYDSTAQPFQPTIGLTGDLGPGECARGYVSFALPEGAQIVAIRWDYPGGGGPLRWNLQ